MKLAGAFSNSTHGGILIPCSSPNTYASGIQCALHGDMHICPRKHHGVTPVIASSFATSGGLRMVRHFDICGCGAHIISKVDNTYSE